MGIWPYSGTWDLGAAYRLAMSALLTAANESLSQRGQQQALLPTPDATKGRKQTRTTQLLPGIVGLLPTPRASASENRTTKPTPSQEARRHGRYLAAEVTLLPTPKATMGGVDLKQGRGGGRDLNTTVRELVEPGRWGKWQPAIQRWAQVFGSLPPEPLTEVKPGRWVLSMRFVEWLMGVPAGHVTEAGLSRTAQVRILGNGVMPEQGALAFRLLMAQKRNGENQ